MQRILRICLVPVMAMLMFGCRTLAPVQTSLPEIKYIDKYGGVWLEMTGGEFQERGYACADIVQVDIAGQSLEMPVVPNFRFVKAGEAALVVNRDPKLPLSAAIYYGEAASRWNIAVKQVAEDKRVTWVPKEGIELPLPVTIRLRKKGGYADQLLIYDLKRTNDRVDYADLTDAEFANFRVIRTSGMGKGVLCRSSSPINPALGRNAQADAAARAAGVRTVINMVDTEAEATGMKDYAQSYCATCPTVFLHMGVDSTQPSFGEGVRDAIRFMLAHEGPYLLHCKEGQDRTGFLCAVLELLQGASLKEVTDDYLLSFRNYYRVQPQSRQAKVLVGNIQENLKTAFKLKSLRNGQLADAARQYLLGVGLSEQEFETLKGRLAKGQ